MGWFYVDEQGLRAKIQAALNTKDPDLADKPAWIQASVSTLQVISIYCNTIGHRVRDLHDGLSARISTNSKEIEAARSDITAMRSAFKSLEHQTKRIDVERMDDSKRLAWFIENRERWIEKQADLGIITVVPAPPDEAWSAPPKATSLAPVVEEQGGKLELHELALSERQRQAARHAEHLQRLQTKYSALEERLRRLEVK